ncbi:hypothetical protein FRC17_002537 [Serendipita sp. 399]|nr:hypothetical protein FRC17_002537 [Serendipita sp. 399]
MEPLGPDRVEKKLPSTSESEFRSVLSTSKNIIVVAGAGLSAASGVPTFRGAGGLWRALDATSLATPDAFKANPALCWQFYHYRREKYVRGSKIPSTLFQLNKTRVFRVLTCELNEAHYILARLSIPSVLKKIAPQARSYNLITQNVDGLSVRALRSLDAEITSAESTLADTTNEGTKKTVHKSQRSRFDSITEMHGRLFEVRCTSADCDWAVENYSSPLCPALGAGAKELEDIKEGLENHKTAIAEEDLPHCQKCGALARPGVVWFGEKPRHLDQINLMVFKADLCLVIGTSSTVWPASGFAHRVQKHGGKVAIFNLDRSENDEKADFLFLGSCETKLASVLGLSQHEKSGGDENLRTDLATPDDLERSRRE